MTGVIQEAGGQEIHFFDLMMQHQLYSDISDIPDTLSRILPFSNSCFDSCSMIFNVQVSFWLLFHLCAANTDCWQGCSGPPCSWGAPHSKKAYSLNYIVPFLPWAENLLHRFLALLSACYCQTQKNQNHAQPRTFTFTPEKMLVPKMCWTVYNERLQLISLLACT